MFFNKNYDVQLGDFGMSGNINPVVLGLINCFLGNPLKAEDRDLYKTKRELNGTLQYLPPEMMQFQPASYKSDTWALGIILYAKMLASHNNKSSV